MTIDEAIKGNRKWLKEHPHLGAVNGYKALPPYESIQLGIEALECVRYAQEIMGKTPTMTWAIKELGLDKLPSETEKPEEQEEK